MHRRLYFLLLAFTLVTCYKDCFKKVPLPTKYGNVRSTILSGSSEMKFVYLSDGNPTVSKDVRFTVKDMMIQRG